MAPSNRKLVGKLELFTRRVTSVPRVLRLQQLS
jgi:hypothetical protein